MLQFQLKPRRSCFLSSCFFKCRASLPGLQGPIRFLSSPMLKSSYHRVIVGENNLKFLPIYERVTATEVAVFVCFLGPAASPETEEPTTLPATSALEEMALYSNKRKLRQGRRSLETAVPT